MRVYDGHMNNGHDPNPEQMHAYGRIGTSYLRCVSAYRDGSRCARLPGHKGRCAIIRPSGAIYRFAYCEPHPELVAAADRYEKEGWVG